MSLKFAIVGCGRIAKKHAEILGGQQLKNARLSAVCDINLDRAEHYGKMYDVSAFSDYRVMMDKMGNDIDVINILTPSGMHAQHCVDLAQYKKHIVVEKPMALQLSDADAMIEACNLNNIRLFVVKQNRFNPPVIMLKEALDKNRFGKLVLGTVRVRWCRDERYYGQDSWRGTWAQDGGVFTNQASHHIDLLEWIMGEVESVFAKSSTALVNIETEDTGVAVLKFSNGALGVIEATTATRPKDLEGSISVLGERGSVEIGGFAVNEMKVWNFVDDEAGDRERAFDSKYMPPNVYGFGHTPYLQSVVDSIIENKPAAVDGYSGRKSLKVINALYESIETGHEVHLNWHPRFSKLGKNSK